MLAILINNKHLERERDKNNDEKRRKIWKKIKKKKRKREEITDLVRHRTGAHR
jgi:hypothetical protein